MQLFLVHLLLWLNQCLVHGYIPKVINPYTVVLNPADDFVFPQGRQACSMAATSVSSLGNVCRVPKFRSMASQQMNAYHTVALS